jgi:hypothetical protein
MRVFALFIRNPFVSFHFGAAFPRTAIQPLCGGRDVDSRRRTRLGRSLGERLHRQKAELGKRIWYDTIEGRVFY